jgi:hypothetical protein
VWITTGELVNFSPNDVSPIISSLLIMVVVVVVVVVVVPNVVVLLGMASSSLPWPVSIFRTDDGVVTFVEE